MRGERIEEKMLFFSFDKIRAENKWMEEWKNDRKKEWINDRKEGRKNDKNKERKEWMWSP